MGNIKRKRPTAKTPLLERIEYKYSLALSYLDRDNKLDLHDAHFTNLLRKCVIDGTEEFVFNVFYDNYFLKYNLRNLIIATRGLPKAELYYIDCLIISSCQKFCIEGGVFEFDKNYMSRLTTNDSQNQEDNKRRKLEEHTRILFAKYVEDTILSETCHSLHNEEFFVRNSDKYDYICISECKLRPFKRTKLLLAENNLDFDILKTSFQSDLDAYLENSKFELKHEETHEQIEIEHNTHSESIVSETTVSKELPFSQDKHKLSSFKDNSPVSKRDMGIREKVDHITQQQESSETGNRGEEIVLEYEQARLRSIGLSESYIEKIKMVSLISDDYGYDISSFDEKGNPKYIEVKSSKSSSLNFSFFYSANEIETAKELGDSYSIYVVLNVYGSQPVVKEIGNPILNNSITLTPVNYKASITIID